MVKDPWIQDQISLSSQLLPQEFFLLFFSVSTKWFRLPLFVPRVHTGMAENNILTLNSYKFNNVKIVLLTEPVMITSYILVVLPYD